MTCPKCQNINPENARFCGTCGNTFQAQPIPQTTSIPQSPPAPIILPNTVPSPSLISNPPSPSPSKNIFIILAVIILLIFCSLGAYFLATSSKKPITGTTSLTPGPTIKAGNGFNSGSNSSLTPSVSLVSSDPKYTLDSDNDSYPDFLETAIGTDPFKDECALTGCDDPNFKNASTSAKNILFILDSSGSMAETAGTQRKMDAAKEALKKYINTLTDNNNVSLMVYGHKGSNSVNDKALSCSSIDILYPLQKINKVEFIKAVDSFQPTGWTPIGGSLKKAKEVFVGRETQKNFVLLISDGIETCDSNPVQSAKDLKALNINPQIDVIGFNLNVTAKTQLEEIAKAGGGTYFDAQTSDELKKTLDTWALNLQNLIHWQNCRLQSNIKYTNCYLQRKIKADSYILKLLNSTKYSTPEWNSIDQMWKKISERYQEIINIDIKDDEQRSKEDEKNRNQIFSSPTP